MAIQTGVRCGGILRGRIVEDGKDWKDRGKAGKKRNEERRSISSTCSLRIAHSTDVLPLLSSRCERDTAWRRVGNLALVKLNFDADRDFKRVGVVNGTKCELFSSIIFILGEERRGEEGKAEQNRAGQ